jgi:taurine dioxygenase
MLKINPVSPLIGAEISGINLNTIDASTFAALHQAFLEHIVIVIRDQHLTEDDFIRFSGRFGTLKHHITKKAHHPAHPELLLMDSQIIDTRTGEETTTASPLRVKVGDVWHTDTSYEQITAIATGMYAVNVPSSGGDTLFSNTYHFYDMLSNTLKQRLAHLRASHAYGGRLKRQQDRLEETERNRPMAIHPLIATHPETGRHSLYFNAGQIMQILDIEPAESATLISTLETLTTLPEGHYRHRWQCGDVVLWDNRCSIHCATGGFPPNERRTNWRSTIMARTAT